MSARGDQARTEDIRANPWVVIGVPVLAASTGPLVTFLLNRVLFPAGG